MRRRRRGKGWQYTYRGRTVTSPVERERIAGIAIPPAWTDVWICPDPEGHLQATGRDARGRKQYRYHPRWREVRDSTKYERMPSFGRALPGVRAAVDEALRPGARLERDTVLALVVRLLDRTLIRVGNSEYALLNNSYGLTTLRGEHVAVSGEMLQITFRGKSGKEHLVQVHDRRLARLVKRCVDLPGYEVFQYRDPSGGWTAATADDVNAYLREIAGDDFSAKDFRTWGGSVAVAASLLEQGPPADEAAAKAAVLTAVDAAAGQLGNTRAVCRSAYLHPAVLDAYADGRLVDAYRRTRSVGRLSRIERAVLAVIDPTPST